MFTPDLEMRVYSGLKYNKVSVFLHHVMRLLDISGEEVMYSRLEIIPTRIL